VLVNTPAWFWDGGGENPYFGILGLSEYLVVTADSVNMATEATASGKPVYVWPVKSRSTKFEAFHRSLRERGATRTFECRLEHFASSSTEDMERVTREVRKFVENYFTDSDGRPNTR